jgi:hypothetical protein
LRVQFPPAIGVRLSLLDDLAQVQFEGWEEWRALEASRKQRRVEIGATTVQACWRGYSARKLLRRCRKAEAMKASETILLERSAVVIQVIK